jgi:thioesterase domain-containing protein
MHCASVVARVARQIMHNRACGGWKDVPDRTQGRSVAAVPPEKDRGIVPALFLIHCSDIELEYLRPLTSSIARTLPVVTISSIQQGELQLRTIEGIAAYLVKRIRFIQPTGPYRIAGWSFGGLLAYEIATQMIGDDEEVEFLGLVESYCGNHIDRTDGRVFGADEWERLVKIIRSETSEDVERSAALEVMRKCTEPDTAFIELIQERLEGLEWFEKSDARAPTEVRQWMSNSYSMCVASRQYFPQQISIPVHLFVTTGKSDGNSDLGWNLVVPRGVLSILPIAGKHHPIVRNPGVEQLGNCICQTIQRAGQGPTCTPEKTYSPVVILQGQRSIKRPPLFCFPGAGDGVTSFNELANCIQKDVAIYGLQPRGLDGELVPHTTVAAASEFYLRGITSVYPTGPLHLLGHSFGGWMAFDLAQRLHQSNHVVESLIIVDSEVPNSRVDRAPEYSRSEAIMELVRSVELLVGHSLNLELSHFEGRKEGAQMRLLHERFVIEGLLPKRSTAELLRGPLRAFSMALRTSYIPRQAYCGQVRLLLADDDQDDESFNMRRHLGIVQGWRQWAPNLVYKHSPGNHMTMLKPPHVYSVAQLCELGA